MDLKKDLSIPDAVIFTSFYPRKNLYYEVRSKPSSSNQLHQEIIEIIQRHFVEQSGNRRTCYKHGFLNFYTHGPLNIF